MPKMPETVFWMEIITPIATQASRLNGAACAAVYVFIFYAKLITQRLERLQHPEHLRPADARPFR